MEKPTKQEIEEAIEKLHSRIYRIDTFYSDKAGPCEYRKTLLLAIEALRLWRIQVYGD